MEEKHDEYEKNANLKPPHPHPLTQIATSPTHTFLLKQWLQESTLLTIQSQTHHDRHSTTPLLLTFFLFHSTFLLLLFLHPSPPRLLPSLLSLLSSSSLLWGVRSRAQRAREELRLRRAEEEARMVGRCVEELKRMGVGFDVEKEVVALGRARSLGVGRDGGGGGKREFVGFVGLVVACCVFFALSWRMSELKDG